MNVYATVMSTSMKMNAYMISMNGMNANAKEYVPSWVKENKKCIPHQAEALASVKIKEYVVETIFRKHCEERREFNKEIMEKYDYNSYVD